MVDSETGLAKNDSVRTSSGFFYELGEDEVRLRGWSCMSYISLDSLNAAVCAARLTARFSVGRTFRAGAGCPGRRPNRLSNGLSHKLDPVQIIKGIERRLSYVTFLPMENGEGLQILRYEVRVGAVIGWAEPRGGLPHDRSSISFVPSFLHGLGLAASQVALRMLLQFGSCNSGRLAPCTGKSAVCLRLEIGGTSDGVTAVHRWGRNMTRTTTSFTTRSTRARSTAASA